MRPQKPGFDSKKKENGVHGGSHNPAWHDGKPLFYWTKKLTVPDFVKRYVKQMGANSMACSIPERVGVSDDTPIPLRVQLRIFERCGGVCHISGRKIRAGDTYEFDHIIALVNGGENRESNIAPALPAAHRVKTNADVAQKSKDDRVCR